MFVQARSLTEADRSKPRLHNIQVKPRGWCKNHASNNQTSSKKASGSAPHCMVYPAKEAQSNEGKYSTLRDYEGPLGNDGRVSRIL